MPSNAMSGGVGDSRRRGRESWQVILPVSAGHFFSHYYAICLPILFPLLHGELAVSFAALGLILTGFNLASGIVQMPIGFLVDRFGALRLLLMGLALEAGAVVLMGVSGNYLGLLILAAMAGVGHAVFHPADYAILSARVDEGFMGRAFSIHTFAGHLGGAAAPATIGILLLFTDWRTALVLSGVAGLLVMAWLFVCRHTLSVRSERARERSGDVTETEARDGWSLLFSVPMLLMFFFFIATSFTSTGIQSFSVTAFHRVQEIDTPTGGSLLSAYLFASAVGVLAGGVIADRFAQHDRVAIFAFLLTGIVMFVIGAVPLQIWWVAVSFTAVGFVQGTLRPARDMMIRNATPEGGMGKAFGFLSMGISLGGAIVPVLLGYIVDRGAAEWVFYSIGLLMLLSVFTVVGAGRGSRRTVSDGNN